MNNIVSEGDWRTFANAGIKARKLANSPNISKYEAQRRNNQADSFGKYASEVCDKQYGVDKIKKRESDHKTDKSLGKTKDDFKYTNGELKRLDKQSNDIHDFYQGGQEYKNGKWVTKESKKMNMKKVIRLTESDLHRIIGNSVKKCIMESWKQAPWEQTDPVEDQGEYGVKSFQNNQNYSHFAVNKATNKIVNGWDYAHYDPSELRQFKNDYFTVDLVDNDLDPKQYKIVTGKYLLRQGIDPNDNNNWANS